MNDFTNMSLQQEFSSLTESFVDTVMVSLEESCLKLHSACTMIINQVHEVFNGLLTILHNVSLIGISISHQWHLSVKLIILVMEMIELDYADSCHLGVIIELSEISVDFITNEQKSVFISDSLQVFNFSMRNWLVCFQEFTVKLLKEIDNWGKNWFLNVFLSG